MTTTWGERIKPTTNWGKRLWVETDWGARSRPVAYITPLEDAYTKVADEDNEIIYIFADTWKIIPATFWRVRPVI